MTDSQITVEVVYGLPKEQALISVTIEKGKTAEEAIQASGILRRFPEIDLSVLKIGNWNRTCKLTDIPNDGDRIEIYRPLIADPKEVRRIRAEKAKVEGRADKVTGGRVKS
ncbi:MULTISPECIES: RnfH family protein [Alteromonadaceae]|uniref:RnfH family protein n=1 Tax=Alteromonadaceae TaxID=72275 RepID=UPI001C090C09|nr:MULTISPECIES: RnfH family protein [Aliiglaciecola]MBU2878264.1 RnfH family protein [Aliiglaciecola lipolytica]MDO6711824.1 RnfH family protein [Aliiglaciecola sp. 2_MG-2023]MDO6753002.1 RnfH family protein [Aliiglaciecola sp. 1_MG-2023]